MLLRLATQADQPLRRASAAACKSERLTSTSLPRSRAPAWRAPLTAAVAPPWAACALASASSACLRIHAEHMTCSPSWPCACILAWYTSRICRLLQSLPGWDHMSKLACLRHEALSFLPGRRSVCLSPVSINYKLASLFKGRMGALRLASTLLP